VWQVLVVYAGGSWIVLKGVEAATGLVGLPEWTLGFAEVMLLVGLPVVLMTTVAQEGLPWLTEDPNEAINPLDVVGRTPAEVHVNPQRHPLHGATLFTWRNALLGGAGAAALVVASVVAYMSMWVLGIGPVGSLVAQGIVDSGDQVLVAQFEDATGEHLGGVVTEVLRVDLEHSTILRPVSLDDLVVLLEAPPGLPREGLSAAVALELAAREGFRVVLDGEIAASEGGYLVTASLRDGSTGRPLAAFRSRAADPERLVGAVDRLALRVRERVGESLKTIRAEEPMVEMTVAGVGDLRRFHQARTLLLHGDPVGAVALLEEVVRSSDGFALAWRELAPAQEQAGDTVGALRSYRRVLELWTGADPRGRAARAHAAERIEALGG
jgi:hypothetical protein